MHRGVAHSASAAVNACGIALRSDLDSAQKMPSHAHLQHGMHAG